MLPSAYTQPGGWVVVQALGGSGGTGYPPTVNLGGSGGRAQAVVPAETLDGETLYLYVGENGAAAELVNCQGVTDACLNFAAGGAASMVTTDLVPDSFVNGGCDGSPADMNVLTIAGGGGGGGVNGKVSKVPSLGGNGGIAIGGSGVQNVVGTGSAGSADPSSYAGQAPLYGNNPYDGTQTVSGGVAALIPRNASDQALTNIYFGGGPIGLGGAGGGWTVGFNFAETWLSNSPFLSLSNANDQSCSGGQPSLGGSGGGGHTGGGGGMSLRDIDAGNLAWELLYGAGGGGGSSWASCAGTGVTLPAPYTQWQALADESASQIVVTVHCDSCGFLRPTFIGYIGQGIPDSQANFKFVNGVAWDGDNGRVLILTETSVEIYSTANNLPPFSFYGSSSGMGFDSPEGIAWDNTNQRILVADTGNHRVQILGPGSEVTAFGSNTLLYPQGIDWDPVYQRIVVTDFGTNRVYFFDANGNLLSFFKFPGNGNPYGIAWHGDQGYITDGKNLVVWSCPDNGQNCSQITQPGNGFPIGVAWDLTNQRILVGNEGSRTLANPGSVQAFDQSNNLLYTLDPDTTGPFTHWLVEGVEWANSAFWILIADDINKVVQIYYQSSN